MIPIPRVAREQLLSESICNLFDSALSVGAFESGEGKLDNLVETWKSMRNLPMPAIDQIDQLNNPSPQDLAYAACFAMGSKSFPASTLVKVAANGEGFQRPSAQRHEPFAIALNLSLTHDAMLCVDQGPLRTAFALQPRQFALIPDAQLLSGIVNAGTVLLFYYPRLVASLPQRPLFPEFHGLLCPPTASVATPPYPDNRSYWAISLYASKATLARLLPSRCSSESSLLFDWLERNTRPCHDKIPGLDEVDWHWVSGTDTFVGLASTPIDPVSLSTVFVVSSHYRTVAEAVAFLRTVIPGAKEARSTQFAKAVTLDEGLDDLFD